MTRTSLPEPMEVRDLLSDLLGRDCEVTVSTIPVTGATRPGVIVARYVTDAFYNQALVALDTPLAAHLGAAIALVPPATAQASIRLGTLSAALLENVAEVLNVMAALVNVGGAPHVRLDEVLDSTETPLPAELWRWLEVPGPRLDAVVAVRGYGTGGMSVIVR